MCVDLEEIYNIIKYLKTRNQESRLYKCYIQWFIWNLMNTKFRH